MSPSKSNNEGLSLDFGNELSKNLTIHKNVKQEIIVTTSDKIRIVLINAKEVLIAQRDWWTPFGLLISFITTLCTADFKDAFQLSREFWHAIFVLLTIASAFWFVYCIYKLCKNWGEDNLDIIIEKIKLKHEGVSESTGT